MSWNTAKLDQLGSVGRGRSRHRPRNDPSLYGGDFPFVQTADIASANYYIESYSQTYNEKGLEQSKLWTEETLCMTIAGENTAKTAVLNFPACFPDSIVGFIPDKGKADIRFVKHALDLMKSRFRSVSKGATQDNLSLAKILSFDIPIPQIEYQRKISAVLSAYDDLIENNKRRISLLEEAARLLYREWFVHFRFPGREHVKIVDGVPEGWEQSTIGEHCPLIYGKALKAETRIQGNIDVYGSSGIVGEHNQRLVSGPAIIVGRKGNVGSIFWARRDFWPIDTVYYITPENSDFYTYYALQNVTFMSTDVAVPGLNRDFAHSRKLLLPTDRLLKSFHEQVEPIQAQIGLLERQIAELARARDLLLPRLMDGRLEV